VLTEAKPWLDGFDERTTRSDGTEIRYLVGGSGAPLMLVHGLGGCAANWSELAPRLAARRRVLVPELPGHGGSSPPGSATTAALAAGVGAVLECERVVPAPVVGHSLGGVLALRLALGWPELVSGLVLAAGAGISSGTPRTRRTLGVLGVLRPARRISRWRAAIGRSPTLTGLAFSPLLVSDPRSLSPRSVDGFLCGHRHHTDWRSASRALVADDPRSALAAVRCPALVLWGANDRQLPLDDAFDYARRLRAPLRVVPDCGHLLIGERPDACLDAIETFLRTHEI
jgi:pimeloyl-ACP methyl ester carboxylesterase